MTAPESASPAEVAPSRLAPTGVRIASTLCWVVGVLTILVSLAAAGPTIASGGWLFIAINLIAGALVCVAAVLIRRQRKVGVLVMLVAWAIPTGAALLQHASARGSLLLLLALLFAAGNWKHFH